MTGGEHQPQQVVAYVVIDAFGNLGFEPLVRLEPTTEQGNLVGQPLVPSVAVEARLLATATSQAPGCRALPTPATVPSGDQGVVGEILGKPDIASRPCQRSNEAGRLDPPDRLDLCGSSASQPGTQQRSLRQPCWPSTMARVRRSCSATSGV